jgi:hypothetical protein
MPYIDHQYRKDWDEILEPAMACLGDLSKEISAGELNYILTRLIMAWAGPSPDYSTYNAVMGVLECVKQELYRRKIAPFEDDKKRINGDVY